MTTGKKSKPALCPLCKIISPSVPAGTLKLDIKTGKYNCGMGHSLTVEALREALESGQNTDDVAAGAKEAVIDPVAGQPEAHGATSTEPEDLDGQPAVTDPFAGHETIETEYLSAHRLAKNDVLEGAAEGAESSHAADDVIDSPKPGKPLILPNGDMLVEFRIPESLVGPVQELAAEVRLSPEEWLQGEVELFLNGFFQRV